MTCKKDTLTNSFQKELRRTFTFMALITLLMIMAAACSQEEKPPEAAGTDEATVPSLVNDEKPAAGTTAPEGTTTPDGTLNLTAETASVEEGENAEIEPDQATPAATMVLETEERPPGALIAITMESRVGILLDDIPPDERDRIADLLLERPASFWEDLALRQTRLTLRRLNFRNFVYRGKGQLPLPPQELWSFELNEEGPERQDADGRDVIVIDYLFSSTLLSDAESPGKAEPQLEEESGNWEEPYILPLDPELLLQRTGNACLNEAGFPPNSYDSENAWVFFDYTCLADSGGALGCHRTTLPQESCVEALERATGTIETAMQFERLPWDEELADAVRVGEVTTLEGADLQVVGDDLANARIVYRYIPGDSCALAEQCVGGSGWRRLLEFSATVHNVGSEALHIGPVVAEDPDHNLFQYNACHNHFHFSDYGDFTFGDAEQNFASKQAFCVESTNRLSNNEWSPLTHDYSCRFQGVQAGWVDEYIAGLDCQWIDITDVDIPDGGAEFSLGFLSNPDGFLCEGQPVTDERGNLLWEQSDLTDENGLPVERPMCDFVPEWESNNEEQRALFIRPAGSFVTEACEGSQIGPLRNCGFEEQRGTAPLECSPGQQVRLSCSLEEEGLPQILRLCEYSEMLGTGVACGYGDALYNGVVGEGATSVTFTCPLARSAGEPGGLFALYSSPLTDEDEAAPILCSPAG